jgi:hypothetical protein
MHLLLLIFKLLKLLWQLFYSCLEAVGAVVVGAFVTADACVEAIAAVVTTVTVFAVITFAYAAVVTNAIGVVVLQLMI